jgi:hypothetical protein
MGATMKKTEVTETDVLKIARLSKDCVFISDQSMEAQYSTKTKLKIFSADVISMLLFGFEFWRTIEKDEEKLNTFYKKKNA